MAKHHSKKLAVQPSVASEGTEKRKTAEKKPGRSTKHALLDRLQWMAGAVLIIGGAIGFSYYNQYPFLYRLFALLAALVAGLLLFWKTEKGASFLKLMRDSQVEIRKVIWPTRSELWQTVWMVVAVALISALVFWLADVFFAWLISLIIE